MTSTTQTDIIVMRGGDEIKVLRTEQIMIKPNHEMYSVINEFSIKSRIMYNHANWFVRQCYTRERYWLRYQDMQKFLKHDKQYKDLMSQSSQCVLQVLDRNWKSFFNGNKSWNNDNTKFLGKPKLPKYIKSDKWVWFLKNNQTYIEKGKLYFRLKAMNNYGFKVKSKGRLISVRFVPRNNNFVLEVVCEKEIKERKRYNDNYASIDLGLNNFITMVDNLGNRPTIIKGGYVKSENQWYNKYRAELQSKLTSEKWSKKLNVIAYKRHNRLKNYMHHVSKYIIDYCKAYKIHTLVVGINETWKQEINLGNKNNQNFVFIPYDMLIKQLEYKCEDAKIRFIKTEENYTSGTSFIDNELPIRDNYDRTRRIKRGLFKSNNGILINSDVNGACQIMKKVYPNAFDESYGIEDYLNPIIIKDVFDCYKWVG